MKKIAVITSTRAEYGLLRPIFFELKEYKNIDVKLIVTGTHLSKKFGMTYKEIISDKIDIYKKINIIDDRYIDQGMIFSTASKKFFDLFHNERFNAIIVLGDRYEMLAIASAAMLTNTPICHLYGGETTEGAIDEVIRHSITKMSYLHFTSAEEYKNRIIQLGEDPKRVFNYGSVGIENIVKTKLLSKKELSEILKFDLDKYFVVTYHPVTLSNDSKFVEFSNMLKVLLSYKNYQIIFTMSNADAGGEFINSKIANLSHNNRRILLISSLGTIKYFSLIKYSLCVVGNSSSGIIEVPTLGIPCVNIGDRQRGRLKPIGVIDSDGSYKSIKNSINKALHYSVNLNSSINPFYKKNTSVNIAKKIVEYVVFDKFDLKKKFYDIKFMVK